MARVKNGPATGIVGQQGTSGNYATVGKTRRKRGGGHARRQQEKRRSRKVEVRVGILNVGTMNGKGREIADVMERRKIDILCACRRLGGKEVKLRT